MKATTFLSGLLAALTTTVSAQLPTNDEGQTGPFWLQLKSNDSSVDGQYLGSCHTGAAQQTLCLSGPDKPDTNIVSYLYLLNRTDGTDENEMGILTWNLPLYAGGNILQNVSIPFTLQYTPGSNVATSSVSIGGGMAVTVGFRNDTLYIPNWIDDSNFVEGQYPNITGQIQELNNFYACWVLVAAYYYQALTWVTSGAPHNRNCKPVDVVRIFYEN
ncbi:hypothetical protein V8F06_002245 [Rhypophila decipiens]